MAEIVSTEDAVAVHFPGQAEVTIVHESGEVTTQFQMPIAWADEDLFTEEDAIAHVLGLLDKAELSKATWRKIEKFFESYP
jgi:hypothetical protein